MKHRSSLRTILFRLVLLPVWIVGLVAPASAAPAAAPPAAPPAAPALVTIDARDYPTGDPLTDFTFIVNDDNSKLPSDQFALNSESHTPLVAIGDASDPTVSLPSPGRYLVSVRSLGHKMWGKHITLPADAGTVRIDLTVTDEAHPLPLGKLTTFVFDDRLWTNGAPDAEEATEEGGPSMPGFRVEIKEQTGSDVTVDYNNDPLCGDGVCLTDADGFNTIDNLGPATYFIHVHPPAGACNDNPDSRWYQTTTIDGGLSLVAPVEEGSDGTGAPGEQLWEPAVGPARTGYWFGFVCVPTDFSGPYVGGTGEIVGQARNWVEWAPYTTGTYNEPVDFPFIALTDSATDATVFVGRGDEQGNFDIQSVPAGTYNMSIWDEQLNYIMRFKPVTVGDGEVVDVNDVGDDGEPGVGVSRWFGWLDGTVYKDLNGNGQYDAGTDETLGNTDVDQRWRDGSIKEATFTDPDGYYVYPTAEGGALGRWIINEQGFARFSAFPGASVHDEHTGAVTPSCATEGPSTYPDCVPNSEGGGLLMNQFVLEGHRSTVDWGKVDYPEGTPGQIVGVTYFATTRNEFNAALQAHEDYEPGIPDVTVYLETFGADGLPNTSDDVIVNSYVTDHWAQPNVSQDFIDPLSSFSQDCSPIRDFTGADVTGQFNPIIGPNCLEVPLAGIQTKEGKFDGGYAFADYCPESTGGFDLNTGVCMDTTDPVPLVAGDYIVHSIMPTDANDARTCNPANDGSGFKNLSGLYGGEIGAQEGCLYRIVREEDVNVDLGNQFTPQIPPPPCVGDNHILEQATLVVRSPLWTADQSSSPHTGDTTSGSATVADLGAAVTDVGRFVFGPGIPAGAQIVSVVAGTSFTMDVPATATALGVTLTIGGSPSALLCDKKLVVLQNGQNANADFNMMTNFRTDPNGDDPSDTRTGDVAIPGRFVGQVFNDIYFERNQMSPWYGEPRPIGGIPVGIYARVDTIPNANPPYSPDKWRLITTVTTSLDGSFEAILPSTETFNCPIPQGPCPGMYLITVDDPGTIESPNPHFNPNLLVATTPGDSWPGLTNEFLDLPLDPISGTACDFSVQAPDFDEVASTTPELLQVSQPYVNESDTVRQITILADFIGPAGPTDATGGHVNLTNASGSVTTLTQANGGIVSWVQQPNPGTPDTIVIQVPPVSPSFPPGPRQLTIVGADDPFSSLDGKSSVNGITLHVLGNAVTTPTFFRTATANTFDGHLVRDGIPGLNSGDVGAAVTGSGIPGSTTITGVSLSGPALNHYFTTNNLATSTGFSTLTLTKSHAVTVGFGGIVPSHTAADPLIVNAGGVNTDALRSVAFSGGSGGAGLGGAHTILTVSNLSSFTFSGTGNTGVTPALRTATITTSHSTFINTGTFVVNPGATAADIGKVVTGPGIPPGTTITTSPVTYTLGPVTFTGFTISNVATANSFPGTVSLTLSTPAVVAPAYNPPVVLVAAPPLFAMDHTLQNAIDAANPGDLLVLSEGTYNENILLWKPLKIQGLGPGGIIGAHEQNQRTPEDPRFNVHGTILDGRFFQQNATDFDALVTANGPYAVDPTYSTILRGAEITVVAQTTDAYGPGTGTPSPLRAQVARIDGLGLQAGKGVTQGNGQGGAGGIQLQAYINNLQITNNILENNGGLFAGGIGVGQPYAHSNNNHNVRINNNRVLGNGGLTRAGGIGVFYDADNYEIGNSIYCGNYGVEYGAGISHWGHSPGGRIHDNQIYYNDSVDSGAGISLQSEVPVPVVCTGVGATVATCLGDGTGAVDVDRNLFEQNYSNDDGGGILVMNALNQRINIRNNMIVDNGAADLGGAILLDDSSNVAIINNSIANNITTASSENSCSGPGCAHGAGLTSEANEPIWTAALGGSPTFSNPVALFNNIFWNNNAFTLTQFGPGATLVDEGFIDFEISSTTGTFTPRFSDLTNNNILVNGTLTTVPGGQANQSGDPGFAAEFALSQANELQITGSRGDPQFVLITLTGGDPPVGLTGDYHLAEPASQSATNASFVIDRGARCSNTSATTPTMAVCTGGIEAPSVDYDMQLRPELRTLRITTPYDLGADELPSTPAPFANILDNFNRANAATLGPNWISIVAPASFAILSNQAQAMLNNGYRLWKPGPGVTAGNFGPRQFAFMYISKVVGSATDYDLLLKANNLGSAIPDGVNATSSVIKVQWNPSTNTVTISTYCGTLVPGCGSQGWQVRGTFPGVSFAVGDQFAAVTRNSDATNSVVEFYQNGVELGSIETNTAPAWPSQLTSAGGRIGVLFVRSGGFATPNDARFDDFGGGSLP